LRDKKTIERRGVLRLGEAGLYEVMRREQYNRRRFKEREGLAEQPFINETVVFDVTNTKGFYYWSRRDKISFVEEMKNTKLTAWF